MRILFVCQHYWPEQFQTTEICEELASRGHDVTALVGIPNYPTGIVPEEYQDGKNREQIKRGVKIIRCEEIPRSPGISGLARNYFSYMRSASQLGLKIEDDFDVVFAYQITPVLMAAPAAKIKKTKGTPVFLYCADIWPDAVKAMLPHRLGFLMPAIKAVSTHIYRASDIVGTNSRAYLDCFELVHGMKREQLFYIPQYAEDEYLDMNFDVDQHEKVRFMVMGNIGKLQQMGCMLNAVKRISRRNDFELHIVGTGSAIDECKKFVADNGLERHVVFHGRHPYDKMPDFYRLADACVLTLNVPGAPWISSTLPSRLQGYMAAGKPILAAISGSANEVIRESGCGKAVEAGDDEGLAALFEDFIDNRGEYENCGERGRAYYRERFTKARYMDDIEKLLEKTAERN